MDEKLKGCAEGFCYVTGKSKGMHTNGGCRCIRNLVRSEKSDTFKAIEIEILLNKLHIENEKLLQSIARK